MSGTTPREASSMTGRLSWLAPVVALAIAYALWWVSDRLGQVGPLDRAAFGWSVVVPVALAAPVVAGLVWRGLALRQERMAALAAGAIVGVAAAVIFWRAAVAQSCETAPTRTAADWILPSALTGAFVGVSLVAGGLAAAALFRGHQRVAAIVAGVVLDGLILTLGLLVLAAMLSGPGCERPVISG